MRESHLHIDEMVWASPLGRPDTQLKSVFWLHTSVIPEWLRGEKHFRRAAKSAGEFLLRLPDPQGNTHPLCFQTWFLKCTRTQVVFIWLCADLTSTQKWISCKESSIIHRLRSSIHPCIKPAHSSIHPLVHSSVNPSTASFLNPLTRLHPYPRLMTKRMQL